MARFRISSRVRALGIVCLIANCAPAPLDTGVKDGQHSTTSPRSVDSANEFDIRLDDGSVFIAADDIRSYDWSSHTLSLTYNAKDAFYSRVRERRNGDTAFMVALGGDAVYTGTLTSCVSSRPCSTAVIVCDAQMIDQTLANDQIRIQLGYPTSSYFKGKDPRSNPHIHDALKAAGKLKDSQ